MSNITSQQDLHQAIKFALACFEHWDLKSAVEDYYQS